MSEQHKCCATIYGKYNSHSCGKNAKYERGGKHYCGTHDPLAVKEKIDARNVKYRTNQDAKYDAAEAANVKRTELERNAARYVFLRSQHEHDGSDLDAGNWFIGHDGDVVPCDPGLLDAAIDAAIAKDKS